MQPQSEGHDRVVATKPRRKPTPKQLVRAAEIVRRYAESLNDPTAQEVSMATYTADNMSIAALAESARSSGAGR